MLSIHGGPHSIVQRRVNFAWQEHAANGYVVLYPFNDEWHGTSSRPSKYLRTQPYLRSWVENYSKKGDNVAVK